MPQSKNKKYTTMELEKTKKKCLNKFFRIIRKELLENFYFFLFI